MNVKKVSLSVLVSLVLPFFVSSKERPKTIPLEELTNPKSPSYVPVPYPKNEKEIMADLDFHLLRSLLGRSVTITRDGEKKCSTWGPSVLAKLRLDPNSGLKVRQILTETNRCRYVREPKNFIVEFEKEGKLLCRYLIGGNGSFQKSSWGGEDTPPDSLPTDEEIRELLIRKHVFSPATKKEDLLVQRVVYDGMLDMDSGWPYSYVEFQNRKIFINNHMGIFELSNRIDVCNRDDLVKRYMRWNRAPEFSEERPTQIKIYLYDSISEEILELVGIVD